MKVLIFGHKGWIGSQFLEILDSKNIEYKRAVSRADNENDVEEEILTDKPTHIVSFIGRTHGIGYNTIDYLEQPGKLKENVTDNLYAPMVLAILSRKHNIHFTYLGTGCIFNQENPYCKAYTEFDKPDFFGSSYSTIKGITDCLMHFYDILNLRIRMPITGSNNPRNFITKIVNYEKVCSISNSMTVLPDMLPVILEMMKEKLTGTFNLVNPGIISHNEILEMYKEIVDNSFTWKNFSIDEQNEILSSKRSNNQLDTTKLLHYYNNIPDIHTSVRNCLIKIKIETDNIVNSNYELS